MKNLLLTIIFTLLIFSPSFPDGDSTYCFKSIEMYQNLLKQYPDFPKKVDIYKTLYYASLRCNDSLAAYYKQKLDSIQPPPDPKSVLKEIKEMEAGELSMSRRQELHFKRGEVYYQMGKTKKAKKVFRNYLKKCTEGEYTEKIWCRAAEEYLTSLERDEKK